MSEPSALLQAAWDDAWSAHAGEDRVDALLAHAAALSALPWSKEAYAHQRLVRHALLASPRRQGLEWVTTHELPIGCRATVAGLLLRDDDPLTEPLPDNPWKVGRGTSLRDALTQIWRPIDDPDFVRELTKRVLGLALLRDPNGEPLLGYLLYHERDSFEVPAEHRGRERPPFDRRAAFQWQPFGDATVVIGHPPGAEGHGLRAGVEIPSALEELYRIHAGMAGGLWSLYRPEGLMLWSEMLGHDTPGPVRTEDEDEERRSDELLAFFSYGDDRSDLFDLAADPDEPPVRAWGDGMLYAAEGEPFWDWFTGNHGLFLRRAES